MLKVIAAILRILGNQSCRSNGTAHRRQIKKNKNTLLRERYLLVTERTCTVAVPVTMLYQKYQYCCCTFEKSFKVRFKLFKNYLTSGPKGSMTPIGSLNRC